MNIPKSICHIVQNNYPADTRICNEAQALLARGHKVSIVSLREPNRPNREIVNGVHVHRVGFPKKRSGFLRYLAEYVTFFVCAFLKLNQLDRREHFDCVQVSTLPDFLVFCTAVQKLKRCRIVLDMHEIMPEFFMSKFHVSKKHPIVRILVHLEKLCLKYADDVITVNDPIGDVFKARAIPNKPVTVVMNTLDEQRAPVVRSHIPHTGFNCVYHGTLTALYGLDTTLRGFARVCERHGDVHLHIFGSGEQLPDLISLADRLSIGHHVTFHGFIPHSEMIHRLREMDLGLLTYRKDIFLDLCFSTKLADYICSSIPVICSNLATTQYYFSSNHILYFMADDIDDLSAKIEFAYNNRNFIHSMAASAYDRYRSFAWPIMAERYVGIFEASTGRDGATPCCQASK